MTIAATHETKARRWLAFVEPREAARLGQDCGLARARIAGRIGQSPGTLENVRRGRLKRYSADLVEGLRKEFIRAVEREIGTLQHERDMARAGGSGDPDLGEVEAHLAALQDILKRRKGGDDGEQG